MTPWPDVADAVRKAMRANRPVGTRPEMIVRRLAHRMGYRYRLHRKDLPGKPDLAFSRRKKVIFVHGCFWHCHSCKNDWVPKTRTGYWRAKFQRNRDRDAADLASLVDMGWSVMTIWECETKQVDELKKRLARFLGPVVQSSFE
jgi:DNA mismatch endonuclease, patch repair protein